MRRFFVTATAMLFALPAVAQQPQQCLNPQLVNGLVFQGRSDLKISVARAEPAFMRGVRLPASLVLIGNGVREDGLTIVAYKTSLPSEKAYAAVTDALGVGGWLAEAEPGQSPTFVVAGSPKNGTLCRDAERRHVMVRETAGARFVSVMDFRELRRRECNEDPFASMVDPMSRANSPRFEFPEGTAVGRGGSAGGGSNSVYTNSSRIISTDEPARLMEHLAGQLRSQGWQAVAEWSGSGNTGSTWRRNEGAGLTWGTLEIIRVSEHTYDVDFTTALQ